MHAIDRAEHDGFEVVRLRSPAGVEAAYAPGANMVGCSLTHEGDELLAQRKGLKAYAETGSTFGIPLLHPWANRLDADTDSPLVRRDPNGLPIHGVVPSALAWRVEEERADEHVAHLNASADYTSDDLLAVFPHPHSLTMDVWLATETLTVQTTIRADRDAPVPVAFGYHPYLRLPGTPRENWRVSLPVRTHVLLDERMLPTGATEPANEPLQRLGERAFDNAYTDLDHPATFVLEGGGRRIEVTFAGGYEFAQVYAPRGDELVCFEPMTAPANALITRPAGLREVQPGEAFSASFEIRVARL